MIKPVLERQKPKKRYIALKYWFKAFENSYSLAVYLVVIIIDKHSANILTMKETKESKRLYDNRSRKKSAAPL